MLQSLNSAYKNMNAGLMITYQVEHWVVWERDSAGFNVVGEFKNREDAVECYQEALKKRSAKE